MPRTSSTKPTVTKSADLGIDKVSIKDTGVISYEKGVTKNMGDYNSARISVGITLPINPTAEQIEEAKKTIRIAEEIVTEELEKQIKDLDD